MFLPHFVPCFVYSHLAFRCLRIEVWLNLLRFANKKQKVCISIKSDLGTLRNVKVMSTIAKIMSTINGGNNVAKNGMGFFRTRWFSASINLPKLVH